MTVKINYYLLACIACSTPLALLIIDALTNNLGANPVETLHIRLGDWALRILWLTLAITPLQKLTRWRGLAGYRQLLGLFSFFYASLHIFVYLVIDQGLIGSMIWTDIVESSYIWFGLIAYLILSVLALTSPKFAKKKLGKNWKPLHRWIYLAAFAAILHYFWQLKGNLAEPVFYMLTLVLLLGYRCTMWLKANSP